MYINVQMLNKIILSIISIGEGGNKTLSLGKRETETERETERERDRQTDRKRESDR